MIEVIVCYDIHNNKTRKKFREALLNVGLTNIQESAYWGKVPNWQRKTFKEKIFQNLRKRVCYTRSYLQKVKGKNLQLHGNIDALVITPNSYIPIEFKMSAKKPMPNHLIQLAGYALSLEEMFHKKISHGYLISEKRAKIFRINIDEELRQKVYNTLANIIQDVESGLKPDSNANSSKCAQCEFINFCNDREVE